MPLVIGLVVKGATAFLTRLLVALASEQMIALGLFRVAERCGEVHQDGQGRRVARR